MGKLIVFEGTDGSGKSTLLNILSGLDSFDSGDVEAFGKNMKDFSRAELDNYRNSCISFVFQEYHLKSLKHFVHSNLILQLCMSFLSLIKSLHNFQHNKKHLLHSVYER